MFPDLRLRRLSFEYPGSAGAGPRQDLLAHWPGINPHPPHWKHRVLTTGLPGKSLILFLDFCFTCSLSVNCTSSSVAYLHILLLTTLVRSSLISLSKISDSPTFYLLTSFFLLLLLITTYIVSYASLRFLSQAGYKQ